MLVVAGDHAQPMWIQMFIDDTTGIGLWHHEGNVEGLEDDLEDDLEDRLPMPDELRQRIKGWIDEYTAAILNPAPDQWTGPFQIEHDIRGYELSRELQEVLGARFRIQYMFHTREGRRLSEQR